MELKVDTVSIIKAITTLETEIGNLQDSLANLQQISLSDMHEHWQGSDYDNAYEKKMKPFIEGEMKDYLESIQAYQKYLQNYLNGFKAIHSNYETKKINILGR